MNRPTWSAHARTGQTRRHKKLVFFACEGLIMLYDERKPEEDYNVILPADFERRATELARFGRECAAADSSRAMREEGRECIAGADDMIACVREARFMGDPSDPAVQAFWARHRPGHKSTVSLRAGSDAAGYPEFPEIERGKNTGRTVAVDGQAALVDESIALRLHRPPRRKKRLLLDV
jgi:hypothetical protein